MFLFISGPEIFVVMLIVVMLFGADKIPEMAKGLGKGMRQLKDATNDIKREITESAEKQGIDTDFTRNIKKEINQVKDNFNDITKPIKDDINESIKKQGIDTDFNKDIKKRIDKVKDDIDDLTGPIKRSF
jgi:sec-independent protein translocase protein TatA